MLIYGIGRALVDYYIETSAADIIKTYLSSGGQIPVHIDGAAFNRLLSFVGKNTGTNGLPSSAGTGTIFIREPGGTCVNILKTMAILNRHIHATLSGTIGSGSSTGKQPDPDGFFFIESFRMLIFIVTQRGIRATHSQKQDYGSCRTAYKTNASRARTQCHLVRRSIVLHSSQCLQDFSQGKH